MRVPWFSVGVLIGVVAAVGLATALLKLTRPQPKPEPPNVLLTVAGADVTAHGTRRLAFDSGSGRLTMDCHDDCDDLMAEIANGPGPFRVRALDGAGQPVAPDVNDALPADTPSRAFVTVGGKSALRIDHMVLGPPPATPSP